MITVKLQSEKHAREKFAVMIPGGKCVTISFDDNGIAETSKESATELLKVLPVIKIIGEKNEPDTFTPPADVTGGTSDNKDPKAGDKKPETDKKGKK